MKQVLANKSIRPIEDLKNNNAVASFYEHATKDYLYWSKKYNMHFGYYTKKMNPFRREPMLEEMNNKIMQALNIKKDKPYKLIDLGCGMGAAMNYICSHYKNIEATGYTISQWQVTEGNKNLKKKNCKRAKIQWADITKAPKDDIKADYAIAMESICHTPGTGKNAVIKQLSKRLKKGARFVISDAFALKKHSNFSPIAKYVHKKMCNSWELPALANLNELCDQLSKYGFGQLKIKNISWKVAPSILHVPFAIGGFLLKNWIQGKALHMHSLKNLKGSFATFLSSLCMSEIAYCIISGEKIK